MGYLIEIFREWRRSRYIRHLCARGLRLGNNVYLNDGFFLDPAHCELISIEDNVVFGPGVTVLAHDASTRKYIGLTKVQAISIGRNCFVGARATLLPGAGMGENSILGAGSLLLTVIPAEEVWAGVPAKRLMSVGEYREKLLSEPAVKISEDDFLRKGEAREAFLHEVRNGKLGLIP